MTFANGEHLTGKLVIVNGGLVTFQSDRLGILKIPISTDMSLVVAGNVVIRTTDGKQYEGSMRASAGSGWELATQDNTQLVMISPAMVASITPATTAEHLAAGATAVPSMSRENVWEAAGSKPGLVGPWSADSKLALSGVNSTKSRRLLHWNGELDNTTHIGAFKFIAERVYSTSTNQVGKQFTDDDLTRGDATYSKDLSERTSAYVDFEGLHDAVSFIDKKLILSGGGQFQVLANRKAKLTAFVGPAFIHYSYLDNNGVITAPLTFGAVQFGYRSTFQVPGKLTVQHDFRFDQGYQGKGSYLSYVDARVKRSITRWLYLDGKISDDFDSKAAYRANPNTFRYSAGIGVSFDAF